MLLWCRIDGVKFHWILGIFVCLSYEYEQLALSRKNCLRLYINAVWLVLQASGLSESHFIALGVNNVLPAHARELTRRLRSSEQHQRNIDKISQLKIVAKMRPPAKSTKY